MKICLVGLILGIILIYTHYESKKVCRLWFRHKMGSACIYSPGDVCTWDKGLEVKRGEHTTYSTYRAMAHDLKTRLATCTAMGNRSQPHSAPLKWFAIDEFPSSTARLQGGCVHSRAAQRNRSGSGVKLSRFVPDRCWPVSRRLT